MDLIERLAPQLGLGIDLHQQDGEWPAGEPGGGIERFELARPEIRIDLEHAPSGSLHALGEGKELDLACAQRGREAAVARLVLGGARGRDAECAGPQCLFDQTGHLLALALVRHLGMVGSALAHDVEAQRAVWQLSRHVNGAGHRAERIEVVGEALPIELHAFAEDGAGNILDAFHQVDQVPVRSRRRNCRTPWW